MVPLQDDFVTKYTFPRDPHQATNATAATPALALENASEDHPARFFSTIVFLWQALQISIALSTIGACL